MVQSQGAAHPSNPGTWLGQPSPGLQGAEASERAGFLWTLRAQMRSLGVMWPRGSLGICGKEEVMGCSTLCLTSDLNPTDQDSFTLDTVRGPAPRGTRDLLCRPHQPAPAEPSSS